MAVPNGYKPLPGSDRPPVQGAKVIGPVDDAERIHVTLLLRQKPGSPELHDFDHWQDNPPGKREFFSAEEFRQIYGSDKDDIKSVLDFVRRKKLTVVEDDSPDGRIVVEGAAEDVNAAFGIKLRKYRSPRPNLRKRGYGGNTPQFEEHEHHGFEGEVHLPAELIGVIIAVIGLDDRSLGGPAGIGTGDPPGAHYMTPAAIAQLYNFPSFSAAGQTVGIFEPANDGAAYLASDIQEYITSLGITTPLHIKDIGVKVGGVVQVNNPALVAISPPIGGVLEATLDVSVVAAIAPACQINVYFSRNTEAGWDAFLHRAMHPHAGEHPPSVLSASWVWQFSDGAGSIGSLSAPASAASVINRHFREAAMRGITVFIAIGDWGSGNQVHDGHCHISYPNGDPWVTACGGTIIGDISSTTPPVFEEFTWSDANRPSLFDNYPYNATGGGVSAQFDRPLYQVLSGVLPISKNDGRVRRGVPDVAGMVGMESFFINAVGGYQLFGTSAVAPFYSALIAMINAFLHHNVGFLNPTLYRYGPEICRDITFGNNDSGYTPDAPYYVSGIGWDPCTGWGSLRGLRLLAALTPAPIIATAIASGGRFGNCCVGSFADEILTINNSGFAPLLISSIVSSSPDFLVPSVSSYPLEVGPGESMDVVIRYMPTGVGATTAKITIDSNDLFGPHTITVSGSAPGGKLAVTGSTCFGGVPASHCAERTISICNVGDCKLTVSSVAFKNKSHHWKLLNNPFPAPLHPGSCLGVVVLYRANEKIARSCELVITSDDPTAPVKTLELLAYTVWNQCGCKDGCHEDKKGGCSKCDCGTGCDICFDEEAGP